MLDIWSIVTRLPEVSAPEAARSAVLVPLYRDAEGHPRVILTKRPMTMRTHPGDVVFPGGSMEDGESIVEAAIREAGEEIGLPPEAIEVIGGLTPVTTRDVTNVIVPVVARVERPVELLPDPREVEAIIEPALVELLDESRWRTSDWMGTTLWFYEFSEGVMWGATAFMMRDLIGRIRNGGATP
jgi:8-oxo-dGTP pyrophosphatase MutT (NUDIX family)